jgi:hypothetical protein
MSLIDKAQLEVVKAQATTSKDILFLGLKRALIDTARGEVKNGKLDPSKPYDLKPNADRLIRAWRKNFVTKNALKAAKVTDEELKQLMREVLTEVGVKEIVE